MKVNIKSISHKDARESKKVIMTNNEKLEALKKFLDNNAIVYSVPRPAIKSKFHLDLHIQQYYINVHISNEYDEEFYQHYYSSNPVFIRENETADFVIEKVKNTIQKVIDNRQRRINNLERKEAGIKRHEECVKRREAKIKARQEREAQKALNKPKRKRMRIIHGEPISR